MAQSLDLPLPEITINDFQRSWTRFELVASAKEWDEAKQKLILPTLLRGKLVDAYVLLNETARSSLGNIKKALMEGVGISRDPLTTGQAFMSRHQSTGEAVRDYAADIKKLFKESYPEEAQTSPILLQRFLTGLSPPICRQLLLRGKPTTLEQAIADATSIEYALNFEPIPEECSEVNIVHKPRPQPVDNSDSQKLHSLVESMTKKMAELEAKLDSATRNQQRYSGRRRPPNTNNPRTCWQCGEPGHVRRYCPLNESRPVRSMGGWPRL